MLDRPLRERLDAGEPVLGTFQILDSMMVSEMAAVAGFDFVVIDREHGPMTTETAMQMCAGAQARGVDPVIRVGEGSAARIQRALDLGASGVQVPQIETERDARRAVEAARFHPIGQRGLSPYGRAGDYQGGADFTTEQNARTTLIVQVEGEEAIENLDAILSVDGIDVLFVGPYDLSQSLGVPGDIEDERVRELMTDIVDRAAKAGTTVGTYADTPAQARGWIDAGVTYVTLSEDSPTLYRAFEDLVGRVGLHE